MEYTMKKVFLTLFVLFFSVSLASAGIVFNGTPGSAPPPPTLGGYTMTPFALDSRPLYSSFLNVPSPLGGDINFSMPLNHRRIWQGWAADWAHGYMGDIYITSGPTTASIILPPGTTAFYFYSQPDCYGTATVNAMANDGTSSGPISIYVPNEAKYFGFYTTGGVELTSISISTSCPAGFAVGEFGISKGASPDQNLTFSNIKPNQMNMTWTRGNGDGSFVVVKEGSALLAGDYPVNNTSYSSYNTNYTSAPTIGAAKIAYYGSGNSILLTGLTKLARYYIHSFAYLGDPFLGTAMFNTNPAAGNPKDQRTSRYKHTLLEDETDTYSFDIGDIYPLPAGDNINFNLKILRENNIRAEIYDESGRRLFVGENAYGVGDHVYTIPTKNLGTGTYILNVSSDNDNIVVPFIINR
jgi:hypothetical protein